MHDMHVAHIMVMVFRVLLLREGLCVSVITKMTINHCILITEMATIATGLRRTLFNVQSINILML